MKLKTDAETFKHVAQHLLRQGRQARLDGEADNACAYRGPNRLKCAAGACIDDEHYITDLEGRMADELPVAEAIVKSGHNPRLAHLLQVIHDYVEPNKWYGALVTMAQALGLNPREVVPE